MKDETDPSLPESGQSDPGLTGADLPPMDPELHAWLTRDPAPPMPADVWDRLESALAAEPPFIAAPTDTPETSSDVPATVTDLAARRRSGRLWPVLAGAAGVALVGLVALPALRGGDAPPVADGPLTAEAAIDIPTPNGLTAESADTGDALSTDAKGTEPQVADAPADTPADPPESAAPSPAATETPAPSPTVAIPVAMLDTGTTYSSDAMPTQVTTLLASVGMPDSGSMARAMGRASVSPSPMAGTGLMASPEALHDCMVRLGLPETAQPLLVDHGTFEGLDAGMLVTVGSVLTDGTPGDLHVVVVGMECAETDVATARHFDLPVAR
ncbi:MAG: hypothetical protein VW082_00060 [Candidatus Nanopelagicales bacterium]